MSEKRHRQQQRRARRRATGGSQAAAARRPSGHSARDEAEAGLSELARSLVATAQDIGEALEAEHWASWALEATDGSEIIEDELRRQFQSDLIDAVERIGTADALAALRALSAVGNAGERSRAQARAQRLAARGVAEPPWLAELGRAQPVAAILMSERVFDDGCTVIVEFAGQGPEPHTLGIYIDHNLGGLVKDVFLGGPLADMTETIGRTPNDGPPVLMRDLDLVEARARVTGALAVLDLTYQPPVDEDVPRLRALIDARMELLPAGFDGGEGGPDEMSDREREQLLADFLTSAHGRRWRGNDDAADVVSTAIDFGADYNHGGPLRWSPVAIEIFMLDWLPRKVLRDPVFFDLVPEVLPDWVAYTLARRDQPLHYLTDCTEAIAGYREAMLEATSDPAAWGPAKAFAAAAQSAGVDLADPDALNAFIDRVNAQNAAG